MEGIIKIIRKRVMRIMYFRKVKRMMILNVKQNLVKIQYIIQVVESVVRKLIKEDSVFLWSLLIVIV